MPAPSIQTMDPREAETTMETLRDGSTIGIVGAGPAGTFFALLALKEAEARGIRVRPILFDGKPFLRQGPRGCNMCAGVISWKLLHEIERLGLPLPRDRIQRLIHSYTFHTREGSHEVIPPAGRGPIPVVFRGNGPRFSTPGRNVSFDDFLLERAVERGAELVPCHVESVTLPRHPSRRPELRWKDGELAPDLLVVASGVSSPFGKQIADSGIDYRFPDCVRAHQAELDLGEAALEASLGNSIHVFSLGLPQVRFAAIIPKTRFATVSLVGRGDLSHEHLAAFLQTPTVRSLLPPGWTLPEHYCSCRPRLPVKGARRFYGHRLLFVGDASLSRFYKNGIDSAFRTARLAVQAVFDYGLAARDLRRSYHFYARKAFGRENRYARALFRLNDLVSTRRFWVRAHLHFVHARPQGRTAQTLYFLTWNLFTGDASYRDLFWTSLQPRFLSRMLSVGLGSRLLAAPRGEAGREEPSPRAPRLSPLSPPRGPLSSGQTVAIVGGGPAGTACGIALRRMCVERGKDVRVVLFEARDFEDDRTYNPCAGVLSSPIQEVLVRDLGIRLPDDLVERTIHRYLLCSPRQSLALASSMHRSIAVRRSVWDRHMLRQARQQGVEVIRARVMDLETSAGGVTVYAENGTLRADVAVGAFGLDPGTSALFSRTLPYREPRRLETILTNVDPGVSWMERFDGTILAFLPRIPGVAFGALTPKARHLTLNIAGPRVTAWTLERFLRLPEVAQWLPRPYAFQEISGNCYKGSFPNGPARGFIADRFVAVGDAAGLVRPLKGKGVTSACITGIAAARAMMDYGISRKALHAYTLACREILSDRHYGWAVQQLLAVFQLTDTLDVLLDLARQDPGLRHALFLGVSGEGSFREAFRDGFQLSRAARIVGAAIGQMATRSR